MKRLFAIGLLLFSAAMAGAQVTVNKAWTVSDLQVTDFYEVRDGATYQRLELTGCQRASGDSGVPELPVCVVSLVIPVDQSIYNVAVNYLSSQVPGEYAIYPVQPPMLTNGGQAPPFVPCRTGIYRSREPYPGKLYDIIGDGNLAGFHIVTLALYPVQYRPSSGSLELCTSMEVTVTTCPNQADPLPVSRRSAWLEEEIEALVRSLVANPEAVLSEGVKQNVVKATDRGGGLVPGPMKITSLPSVESMPVDYLIITNQAMADTFQKLADWKTKKGVITQVRTVEWVAQNYSGCDLQERIRRFIQDAYSLWGTGYVLLAGDHQVVPVRNGEAVPTDLYYGDIASSEPSYNWNRDGDDVFGERQTEQYVPSDPNFNKVEFTDGQTGFIMKEKTICRTTNGGLNWPGDWADLAPMPGNNALIGMDFVGSEAGWSIVGTQSGAGSGSQEINGFIVYRTTDGGTSWELSLDKQAVPNMAEFLFLGMDMPDTGKGFVLGNEYTGMDSYKLWKKPGPGLGWTELAITVCVPICLDYVNDTLLFMGAEGGTIFKSTDGGASWTACYQGPSTYYINRIFFLDDMNGWACANDRILHTTNGGTDWTEQDPGLGKDVKDIAFADPLHGCAISAIGIKFTQNGGAYWIGSNYANPDGWPLNSVSAASVSDFWVSGDMGILLHSANGGHDFTTLHSGHWIQVITGDGIDLYPDVSVGRAPVDGLAEARAFVNKIIDYETESPLASYITKMLLMGGSYNTGTFDGDMAKDCERLQKPHPSGSNIPTNYTKYELYGPVDDPTYPYPDPRNRWFGNAELTHDNARDAMNAGYHFIAHMDHSQEHNIGTGARTGGGNFNKLDAILLANGARQSILWSYGCLPNAFERDCFSKHFVVNPVGGGVAFIGNSIDGGLSQYDQARLFFSSFFREGIFRCGPAFDRTQGFGIGTYNPFLYSYAMNLMGDPEMPVWTGDPAVLQVILPASLPMGPSAVTVTVLDSATQAPLDSAWVCLRKGIEAYAVGYTDAQGQITFDYTPESPGEVSVTVTTHNYVPYQGTITIGTAAKYVCYESSAMDDDDLGGTQGNGDGILNPGETADMLLTLRNNGTSSVSKMIVSLSTVSPYVSPGTLSTSRRAGIAPGGTGVCDRPCRFAIAAGCPDQHRAVFHMTVTAGGLSWADSFAVTLRADSLVQTGHGLVELSGNGNGVVEPDETIRISNLEVTDFGSGGAGGVTAQLTTSDPYVTIIDGTSLLGNIAADGKATDPDGFVFSTAPGSSGPYEFTMTLRDRFGREWSRDGFELEPLSAPTNLAAAAVPEGVELRWKDMNSAGAVGYHVYRAGATGGPYTRLDDHAVLQASVYVDRTADPNNTYYYVVTALDASYNESVPSNEASLLSPMPLKTGWPQAAGVRGDLNWNAALPGDLDGDGDKEVVLAANDGWIHAWHHDGTPVSGWPKDLDGAPVSLALADVDKCGLPEMVVGIGGASEFRVIIYKGDGSTLCDHVLYTGTGTASGSLITAGDIDRDGNLDLIVCCKSPCRVYALSLNGTSLVQKWMNSTQQPSGPSGSPSGAAVCDLDGDGGLEVAVGTASAEGLVYVWKSDGTAVPGWPVALMPGATYAVLLCQPVAGDLDGDGKDEIIAQTADEKLASPVNIMYILDETGISSTRNVAGRVWGSPALADIDGDGGLEITACLMAGNGLAAWHHDGSPFWQANAGATHSSPALGDADGNGAQEIFTGSDAQRVMGYGPSGAPLAGFPIPTPECTYSGPFACDLDGNGRLDLGMDMFDGKVYVWEFPGTGGTVSEWPMFHHDAMSSGRHGWLNEFSGPISHDLTLSGDNFFNGDVVVEPGATLTLKRGTRMYFAADRDVTNSGTDPSRCELIIQGSLVAQGAAGDSVVFRAWAPAPAAGDWAGISIQNGGTVSLARAVIEHAERGLAAAGGSPTVEGCRIESCVKGVYAEGGTPAILHSAVRNNAQAGIHLSGATAQIIGNEIAGNHIDKKLAKDFEKALRDSGRARDDSAAGPGTGIYAENCTVQMDSNTVRDNYTGFRGYLAMHGQLNANVFQDNEYQGVDCYGSVIDLTISGNEFLNNGWAYSWPYELAGVSLGYGQLTQECVTYITGNAFKGNYAGARCTKYGTAAGSPMTLWVRDNWFAKGNSAGLAVSSDANPNLTVIGTNNHFTDNLDYGVYVNAAAPNTVNLGNLENACEGDDGGNYLYANGLHDLYHHAPGGMYAQGNYWNTQDPGEIDKRIYDDDEDPWCGPVNFVPYYIWGEMAGAEDAVWTGTVSLGGDLVVPAGRTLKVKPGAVVRFAAGRDAARGGADTARAELIVKGTLKVEGSQDKMVKFRSDAYQPAPGDWLGMALNPPQGKEGGAEGAGPPAECVEQKLQYADVRHARLGLDAGSQAKVEMKGCAFKDNEAGSRLSGKGTLSEVRYEGNAAGLWLDRGASPLLDECAFEGNGIGVLCADSSRPTVRNSAVSGNTICGVAVHGGAVPVLSPHNLFLGNRPYHIRHAGAYPLDATENYWGTMCPDSIIPYLWDSLGLVEGGMISFLPLWTGPQDAGGGAQAALYGAQPMPLCYRLHQNAPNPASGSTVFRYDLVKPGPVVLTIYNIAGQAVRSHRLPWQPAGYHSLKWDCADSKGRKAAAGVYIYRLDAGDFRDTKKMVVLR